MGNSSFTNLTNSDNIVYIYDLKASILNTFS
jgi:hypothetical protein